MDRGGSWGQTACVTCNILRLCWDIKYNISITISGQTQVPTSHLPNISVFSSLYSRKVGTATNVYTKHLSSEQHTQILSGPAQENTPILSKKVDNGHLTFDVVLTKKNWVNESFVNTEMISNPSNVLLPQNAVLVSPGPVLAPSIDEIGKHFCISWLVARLEMTLLATEQYLGNQE